MKDYQGDKALELNKQVIKLTEDVKVRDGLLAQMASETGAEILRLRAEIDRYDKICTEVRNELTAAGIPELTEDRLTVVPLAKRVALLRSELERVKAENEKVCEWQSDSDGIYHTSCGEEFYYECELNECPSTIYCQHCGKKIKEIPAAPEEVHPGN
jgi:uncharacterized small protein (DUF1192 family)